MRFFDDLRTELDLIDAVLETAGLVASELTVRGDNMVDRDLQLRLTIAVNDLDAWRDRA